MRGTDYQYLMSPIQVIICVHGTSLHNSKIRILFVHILVLSKTKMKLLSKTPQYQVINKGISSVNITSLSLD